MLFDSSLCVVHEEELVFEEIPYDDGFESFEEAYHQLVSDLTLLTVESIGLITGDKNNTKDIYITGGFSKNPIFTTLMASYFTYKKVYSSKIPNATSLGAALILWKALVPGKTLEVVMGLKNIEAI